MPKKLLTIKVVYALRYAWSLSLLPVRRGG